MRGFVGYELKRRAAKGIASMSALAPEAEAAGELDDATLDSPRGQDPGSGGDIGQGHVSSSSSSSSSSDSSQIRGGAGSNVGTDSSADTSSVDGSVDGSCSSGASGPGARADAGGGGSSFQPQAVVPPPAPFLAPSAPAASVPFPGHSRSRRESSQEYEDDDSNIEF
jgi:hypothetical protein